MKSENKFNLPRVFMTVLRAFVGWHFLYEGISKLAMDNWSSSVYLMEAKWLLFLSPDLKYAFHQVILCNFLN
jgi:uncharacterized membrane protein YphA (DoxX/SURF4 family)